MPTQPPVFGQQRPSGPRKPWARPDGQPDRRKRGRAGQRDRAQVLREEPLCRECRKNNRVRASTKVDHINPLSEGGSDDRANKQGLCDSCHDAKSAAERAAAAECRAVHR